MRTMADRLQTLDSELRQMAVQMRSPGAVLDRDPDAVTGFLGLPAVAVQQQMLMPARYLSGSSLPVTAGAEGISCAEWMLVTERLAYGDPGLVLASPGPSLSFAAVRALADDAQKDWFFGRVAAWPTWTFFALTEPAKGSAATELETGLTATADGDGWLLNGEKIYIGNGVRAQLGVVFCRRAPGPWGIDAVLVDTADPGFSAEALPCVGLRGARISRLRFTQMRITPDRVLGRDRSPSRRGLHGARQALLWFRPGVASFALGVAQATCDYVWQQRPRLAGHGRWCLDDLAGRLAGLRRLTHEAAAGVDAGEPNVHRIGAVKMRATGLAEEATMLAAHLLGPASLIEHPWLEKTYRDVRAFEFMEGTSHVHRRGVFQGLLRNGFFAPGAGDPGEPGRP